MILCDNEYLEFYNMIGIYFRFYYSNEWGAEECLNHPIVEIPKDSTTIAKIEDVIGHLKTVLQPEVVEKIELRFMRK